MTVVFVRLYKGSSLQGALEVIDLDSISQLQTEFWSNEVLVKASHINLINPEITLMFDHCLSQRKYMLRWSQSIHD